MKNRLECLFTAAVVRTLLKKKNTKHLLSQLKDFLLRIFLLLHAILHVWNIYSVINYFLPVSIYYYYTLSIIFTCTPFSDAIIKICVFLLFVSYSSATTIESISSMSLNFSQKSEQLLLMGNYYHVP